MLNQAQTPAAQGRPPAMLNQPQTPAARGRPRPPAPRAIKIFGGMAALMGLLTLLGILLQPALLQFNPPALRFTPAFTGAPPDGAELQRLRSLSAYYLHPAAQPLRSLTDSAPTSPYRMIIEGSLTRLVQVDTLQNYDWQVAYLVGIQSQGREWLVLYRGSVLSLTPGCRVQAEGLYVPEADGLHADQLRTPDAPAATPSGLLWFERAAWLTGIFILFTIAWASWRKKNRRPTPPKNGKVPVRLVGTLLLLALAFSACTLDITVLLRPDASATMLVRMGDTRQTLDFLRQVPGMAGYMQSALQDLRASGALVDQAILGDQEIFTLQRQLGSGSWNGGSFGPDSHSWINVTTFTEGGQQVYRLTGLVDTSVLYQFDRNLDGQLRSALSDTLNELSLRYTLVMPGAVSYHNATRQQGQTLTWELRPNTTNQIVAEARLPLSATQPAPSSPLEIFPPFWLWMVLLGIFLLTLLAFLLTLRTQPAKTTPQRTGKRP